MPAHVHGEHAVELVERDLVVGTPVHEQRGAVDEPVDAADSPEERRDLILVADVADLVGAGEVDTDDLGAAAPQLGGQLGADAPPRAGDDDTLARHGHARSPVFCSSAASSSWMWAFVASTFAKPSAEVQRAAVEVLDAAARLGDHEAAGADIPRVGGVTLEERVDAPRRDVREAQRGGAETAHGAAVHVELDDATSVGLDRVTVVGLDAGAHHRPVERRDIGDGESRSSPSHAPPPRDAVNSSPRNGSKIAPAASPSASRTATDVQANGMPCA